MLEKIKEFFKNLLKTSNQQYIEAPKEVEEPAKDIQVQRNFNFKSQIAIEDEEEKRILKLQKDFKSGSIYEEDLSEEDFNLLTNLYETQIEKTKQSIQAYKNRIISVKAKLA